MSWNVVATLAAGEESDGLYPTLTDELTVPVEPGDGTWPSKLPMYSFKVEYLVDGVWHHDVHISNDLKLEIYPTRSRIVFYCRKWSKGGFIGTTGPVGLLVAATTAIVSGAAAARRTKGKALAGHIRWEWVTAVGFRAGTFFAQPAVVLDLQDATSGEVQRCRVSIEFGRGVKAESIAREWLGSLVDFRLASGEDFDDDERAKWERLRTSPNWSTAEERLSWVELPSVRPVGSGKFPGE